VILTVHGEGLEEDARGCLRELIQMKFVFFCEDQIRNIATRAGFPGDALTEIVDDHIVEARAIRRPSASILLIDVDTVKSLDHLQDAHLQTGLFQQLACDTFL